MVDVIGTVEDMAAVSLGVLLVVQFVAAANQTGPTGLILGLFGFILASVGALSAIRKIRSK